MTEFKMASEFDTVTEWVPTGIGSLDRLLGGGIPMGKILEISGQYSVGKSTLALMLVSAAQKAGKTCFYSDGEFSLSNSYAERMGVDTKKLYMIRERIAETALDAIEEFATSHKDAVIVLDSIGALLARSEAEKSADGKVIGAQARVIASFCRKIVPTLHENNICLIALNHSLRDVMTGVLMTSGGKKLEYHKSVSINLRKAPKRVMKGDDRVGDVIEVEVRKNKLHPSQSQKTELTLIYGDGFQKQGDVMDEAIAKLFQKQGQFFMWNGERIARGVNALRERFKDDLFVAQVKEALADHD